MNQTPRSEPWHKTIVVQPTDLDRQGHVNNQVFVQWIQDVAVEHWRARAGRQLDDHLMWVVLEHLIQYKRQAFAGDQLEIETWVERPQGIRFPRMVQFRRGSELVVSARTLWCLVDTESRRPRRISRDVLDLFQLT